MRSVKIVIIGAASASFGPAMLADAVLTPELRGSTFALVDLDAERLEIMAAYARRLNALLDAGLTIEHATDRKRALPGAEFVITAVAVRRAELWKLDWQIPLKHGIKGVHIGELPRGVAALLDTQVHVQDLVIEAAVHGSRKLALQALLADPHGTERRGGGKVPRRAPERARGLPAPVPALMPACGRLCT